MDAVAKPTAAPPTDSNGFLLPHYRSFSAVFNHFSKTYRWTFDEAIKHSSVNALAMRRDVFLMGCLRERGLAVVQVPWHIEPEDQKDEFQVEEAAFLTNVIRRTPYLQRMLLNLHEATWYGRYASQIRTVPDVVDKMRAVRIADHRPVNGDKIQFMWDGTPCVMINSSAREQIAKEGGTIVQGERSPLLVLDKPYFRDRFIVHTHETDDADYFEGEMAGAVAGVGIRSRIYWAYWLRDEMLSWAVNYMEKVGTLGILIFYYEAGNAAAKAEAEEAAANANNKTAFAVPVAPNQHKNTAGVDQIPASTAGIETLCNLIADYFERHIERYIVGQSLSSKAESTGLGSSVADLHADTKYRIIKFDCDNMADTLTQDLVKPLQRLNRPGSRFFHRWVFDVPPHDKKDKLEAAKIVCDLGGKVKESEVLAAAGLSKPDTDDDVLGGHVGMELGPDGQPLPGQDGDNFSREKLEGESGEEKPKEANLLFDPSKLQREGWMETLSDGGGLVKTTQHWDESKHPRDEDGRWISTGETEHAMKDHHFAATLRAILDRKDLPEYDAKMREVHGDKYGEVNPNGDTFLPDEMFGEADEGIDDYVPDHEMTRREKTERTISRRISQSVKKIARLKAELDKGSAGTSKTNPDKLTKKQVEWLKKEIDYERHSRDRHLRMLDAKNMKASIEQFAGKRSGHREEVKRAFEKGLPIRKEVLDDYPDLTKADTDDDVLGGNVGMELGPDGQPLPGQEGDNFSREKLEGEPDKPEKMQRDGGMEVLQADEFKYSSTQFNLPAEIAAAVRGFACDIPEDELHEQGRENEPHVTVLFGLHTENADDVRPIVADHGWLDVELGPISIFPAKEEGKPDKEYDVVKVDVISPTLHRLHEKIAKALPNSNKWPTYQPHVTIAYVKPGEGQKYVGCNPFAGMKVTFDQLLFSGRDGIKTLLPMLPNISP